MSASAKKKLRKELDAAKLEEKQLKQQKENRKQKLTTTIFVVVIIAVLVAAIAIGVFNGISSSGVLEKNTVAATVGEHEISSLELSYYYSDTVSGTYNQWVSSYGESLELYAMLMGLDLSKPLDDQTHPEDPDKTWADYFMDIALEKAKSDYVLSDLAEGKHEMTEAEKAQVEYAISSLQLMAAYSGLNDVEAYLRANYGPGASLESYTEYCNRSALATSYFNAHSASLKYDDAQIRAYEKDKYLDYTQFTYANYYMACSSFMTGGEKDENGVTVYSDEEKEAGRAAAEAAANELANCKTVAALDKAIAALSINEGNEDATSTLMEDQLYADIGASVRNWLAEDDRKLCDTGVIASETNTDNGTQVNGYYVVLFLERDDNEHPLANVRHLLVKPESASSNPTDEEKSAAKTKAEDLLKQWKAGEATEESFIALVKENTDDTASAETGGLYEDILPVEGIYEESFTEWAVDKKREAGDTGIIETAHGYHIMFYVGDDEMSYRDYLISEDIRAEDMEKWYSDTIDSVTLVRGDLSRLRTNMVLSQG